jgi:hypothetical protein
MKFIIEVLNVSKIPSFEVIDIWSKEVQSRAILCQMIKVDSGITNKFASKKPKDILWK